MTYKHEVIFCIVNSGFADEVMTAAREFGASGGTVLRARGTANPNAEKLFNIAIQPEKEIVMILVNSGCTSTVRPTNGKSCFLHPAPVIRHTAERAAVESLGHCDAS